ncbi:MAG: hypothetical protein K0U13_06425 [Chlamydiae bacterium]|nr:hypothetical protein [Chlamydiota bacterium]
MIEGELMPIIEGELGTHTVVINGEMISHTELLAQLFELSAKLPNMILAAKTPEGKSFVAITPDQVKLMDEIHVMLKELERPTDKKALEARPQLGRAVQKPQVHRSLFSLASAMNSASTPKGRTERASSPIAQPITAQATTPFSIKSTPKGETHLRVEEREAGGNGKQNQDEQQEQKRKDQGYIKKVTKKSASVGTRSEEPMSASETLGSVGNIYVRFMALMARILGQAEAEAHQLYIKIKDRTDNIDTLSLLMAKINNSDKSIDWTNDEQMKQLVDRAREIGVELPEGKYKWDETEKHLLKENIQMRKDSMEKITQLERTDMQRYLQEASQCHQARSNVLKLLKEVIDTIVHNMRP